MLKVNSMNIMWLVQYHVYEWCFDNVNDTISDVFHLNVIYCNVT